MPEYYAAARVKHEAWPALEAVVKEQITKALAEKGVTEVVFDPLVDLSLVPGRRVFAYQIVGRGFAEP